MIGPKTFEEYVQRVGAPRVVVCDIDVLGHGDGANVWWCRTHEYGYLKRPYLLDGRLNDRCPVSRLEEWRQRRWDYVDIATG